MDTRLAAYLARLGLASPPAPTPEGLAAVQAAHRQAIAFENLDVALGRAIAIESEAVFAKLVMGQRGGYCFEMNRLFADMLALMGLATRPLLARARLGLAEGVVMPRTHVLLLGEIGGEAWIADAGFGGSYVPPLPLRDGAQAATPDGARHRLRHIGKPGAMGGEWLLERAGPASTTDGRAFDHGDWQGQYSFDMAEVAPMDLAMSNHWSCTHPLSRFVGSQIVSMVLPDGFATLTGRALKLRGGGEAAERELADAADYRAVLADQFGIALSAQEVAALGLFG